MDDEHRPWPRLDGSWAIAQEWHHVLFLKGYEPETLQSAAPKVYDWSVVNDTTLCPGINLLHGTIAHFFAFKSARTSGDIGARGLA